jgi:hypothetical protein
VPLPQVVVDALAAHLARTPAVEVEIDDHTAKPKPKRRTATLMLTTARGGPVRRQRFSEVWRRAARMVGVPDDKTLHHLRH